MRASYVCPCATEIPQIWNGPASSRPVAFLAMSAGARTPEELETLLEDAFVVRDAQATASLFAADAVLAARLDGREARGPAIGHLLGDVQQSGLVYVAEPRRILRAADTALIVAERAISVARRAGTRWRYAIALLDTEETTRRRYP
jgi:hypothetical protein